MEGGALVKVLMEWLPIVIPLVALLGGATGWWLQRRKLNQERYRELLERFLLPVDVILKQNKAAFDKLQTGNEQEVHPLEYYPERLKMFFDSLPDSDQRKVFWRSEIDEIQARNQKATGLIEGYISSTLLNPAFVQASITLLDHINGWRSKWNYALSGIPIPAALENELLADVFPQAFETELASQIQQIRAVAQTRGGRKP
ncbi:MAG: hypothetical protein ABR568_21060 [Pyrinomonadaceae bacterium]